MKLKTIYLYRRGNIAQSNGIESDAVIFIRPRCMGRSDNGSDNGPGIIISTLLLKIIIFFSLKFASHLFTMCDSVEEGFLLGFYTESLLSPKLEPVTKQHATYF